MYGSGSGIELRDYNHVPTLVDIPFHSRTGRISERNLLFAGGVIGGAGNGERGGLGGERGGRRLKFEGRMMNRTETEVPDG